MRTSNDEMERRIRHMETHVTDLENTIRTGNIAQVSSELTVMAGHIKRTQTAVINIKTGLKRSIVSPALISVSQLQKELINIQAHLPKGRRLPVTHQTLHDIYQVMVSEVQELVNTLIIHTKIPLVEKIIDLTLVSDSLVGAVKNWAVSDEHFCTVP